MNRFERSIFKDRSVPVVVLAASHHGSLAIARTLGRLGVEMYCIDGVPSAPSLSSRYWREKFIWNLGTAPREATAHFLLEVARKIGKRSILLHTADESAILIADYAEILRESYIFPQIAPQMVRALSSKKEMYFTAKKYGVPTPETCCPRSRNEVEEYVGYATFPVMLKGVHNEILMQRTGWRVYLTRTKEELLDLFDRYNDPLAPTFILQEYIPGGEDSIWMYNGYFNEDSESLFGITGKKLRQTPPYVGSTSLGICVRNDTVDKITRRFMKSIGYRGILDIGYRYDSRDGQYKVLDINPRIGSTFRLFTASNGLDVARVEYLDLTGQWVPTGQILEGRKWLVEGGDIFSCLEYCRDKKLTFGQWLKSYLGVKEVAWFSLIDPLPFLKSVQRFAPEVARRLIRLLVAKYFWGREIKSGDRRREPTDPVYAGEAYPEALFTAFVRIREKWRKSRVPSE
jgi:predicted ATP-grasp superfamily ATP-dependent carboligase